MSLSRIIEQRGPKVTLSGRSLIRASWRCCGHSGGRRSEWDSSRRRGRFRQRGVGGDKLGLLLGDVVAFTETGEMLISEVEGLPSQRDDEVFQVQIGLRLP
jgi:hypothetical protein